MYDRAAALKAFVEDEVLAPLRAYAGAPDRVHIVAHSMGGLDARHFISNLGGDETVARQGERGTWGGGGGGGCGGGFEGP